MLQLTFPGSGDLTIEEPTDFAFAGDNVGAVLIALIPYIMAIAGIILFIMLVAGGFILLTSAGNPDNIKKGQQLIVSSLIGFAVVFLSFWMVQLLQIILGLEPSFGTP